MPRKTPGKEGLASSFMHVRSVWVLVMLREFRTICGFYFYSCSLIFSADMKVFTLSECVRKYFFKRNGCDVVFSLDSSGEFSVIKCSLKT